MGWKGHSEERVDQRRLGHATRGQSAIEQTRVGSDASWPAWVPLSAQLYLAHVEQGHSMRRLARQTGCHASTVMRQIHKLENRRDDELVDLALRRLGRVAHSDTHSSARLVPSSGSKPDPQPVSHPTAKRPQPRLHHQPSEDDMTVPNPFATPDIDASLLEEALPLLRNMARPDHLLAVAADMEKAVLVDGAGTRQQVIERTLAEVIALNGWIECDAPGRVSRYRLSAEGAQLLAQQKTACDRTIPQHRRLAQGETPLALLARRRDKSGQRFLEPDMVLAGERLREDFELARLSREQEELWNPLVNAEALPSSEGLDYGPGAARARVATALQALGPGLGDVALRCCCYLEGLETAEKRMGWSARSGKIVLRIALQRLRLHYDALGDAGAMIG